MTQREYEDQLAKVQAAAEKARQSLAQLQEQLTGSDSIAAPLLNDLRTHQQLTDIDLTAIDARIRTCDKILASELALRDQIQLMKLSAEIERAGLVAKKQALDDLIAKGQQRIKLEEQVVAASVTLNDLKSVVSQRKRSIERLEEQHKLHGPLTITDGKIQIRPIKWQAAR